MTEIPNTQEPIQQFKLSRIALPVLFSLGVGGYMVYKEYDIEKFQHMRFLASSWGFIILCVVAMVIRDAAYIWRMKLLAGGELNWRSAFDVTLMWEFSNTIAPSLTGGTPFMIYMLVKEKLNGGKSMAIIFLTIFLDQFYFVILLPIMLFVLGKEDLFRPLEGVIGKGIMATLTTAYIVLACYGLLLAFGLLVNPRAVRSFLIWLFNTRLLKRWHHIGEKVGSDLVAASDEYKAYDWRFWLKIIASTVIAWSARFFVVNGLLLAFSGGDLSFDLHLLAWGRQSVLFILMFVAITPGGSGLAEFSFVQVLSDICPNPPGAGTLAFLWRLIGFYPYMLLGAWLVPRWIRRIKRK